jgi:hypothetical protein
MAIDITADRLHPAVKCGKQSKCFVRIAPAAPYEYWDVLFGFVVSGFGNE